VFGGEKIDKNGRGGKEIKFTGGKKQYQEKINGEPEKKKKTRRERGKDEEETRKLIIRSKKAPKKEKAYQ